ncbi:MAG: hypothetical protein ACKOAU_03445 [Pirellula sp.]
MAQGSKNLLSRKWVEGVKEDQLRMQDRVIYITAWLPFSPGALAGGEGAGG